MEDDCCRWAGIVCDNLTGHVKQIRLRGPGQSNRYCQPKYGVRGEYDLMRFASYKQLLKGEINPSLQYLEQLEYLDLSCNDFGSNKIPPFIGSLRKLRYLNISNSGFHGEIPHQLGNLSRLQVLGLSSYSLSVRNLDWLSDLSGLQHLYMTGVDLKILDGWLKVITTLPSLVELHFSDCGLSSLPLSLATGNLTSLSVLDLSHNYFDYFALPGWMFNLTSLVSLDLSYCSLNTPISLSSDGFRKLTSLQGLDVSGNDFVNSSWFVKGLANVGSTLVSLEVLDCSLSSSILDGLRNMSSLVRLDLSGNMLNERIPESLGNLCDLKQINLSRNKFGGKSLSQVLSSFLQCESAKLELLMISFANVSCHLPVQIAKFRNLADLQLQGNSISGTIPSSIGKLHNLVNLQLQYNSVSGTIPNSIESLSSLELLSLSSNLLWGEIPYHVGSLSSLKQLDLSYNQLNGSIPETVGQILNLEYLNIGNNLLTGVVNENHFANLTKLKQFSANGNVLTLSPQLAGWVPSFQLITLELSSWSFGPQFPSWLQSQQELKLLDISSLRIPYSMPEWFWNLTSSLLWLNLSHNRIQSNIFTRVPPSLLFLDLSSNNFSGPLPELSQNSSIQFLDLSKNSFFGSLKRLLCPVIDDARLLFFLDLADNYLSGVIPDCWKQWEGLLSLNFENNDLSGGIPKSLGYSSMLWSLNLRNNKLSGKLPSSLTNLASLQFLKLGRNKFNGTIPTWLAESFMNLLLLDLRANKFTGDVPYQLCNLTSIQILDLADNMLSGVLPSCFGNFSVMSGIEPFTQSNSRVFLGWSGFGDIVIPSASLVVKGREDTYSNNLRWVTLLDLSSNNFSGSIPAELTSLVGLMSLNLSRNRLTGKIPRKIGDMRSLESLDLSMNQLDGEIPVSFSSLTFLSRLNLSFNHLTGSIPISTQLQGFDNSSFIGNRLCGPPLTKGCAVANPPERVAKEGSSGSHGMDWGLVISILLGFAAGFWVVVTPSMISRAWKS